MPSRMPARDGMLEAGSTLVELKTARQSGVEFVLVYRKPDSYWSSCRSPDSQARRILHAMENAWESILMEPIAVDQKVIVARQHGAPRHQNARCRRGVGVG